MINEKVIKSLEFDKVRDKITQYCVLYPSKAKIREIMPENEYSLSRFSLSKTDEAFKMLYKSGVSGIEFYDDITGIPEKAKLGATLSMGELLRIARFLKSARILYSSVTSVSDDISSILKSQGSAIYFDQYLEKEIFDKILSEDTISDNASEKLASLRRTIKRLNEQVREKLMSYIRDGNNKYLQENIITMRGNRYVLPVKSEYKSQVGGFVHDQSSTGSTVFIEPAAMLELNNSIRTAQIEEQQEIERILSELSQKVGLISSRIESTEKIIIDFDITYAKAIYAYKTHSVMPILKGDGKIEIIKGRHPLIDPKTVVPVSLSFGEKYNYLLITGPNTGGKTVTLKMTGLFSVMAMCGMFVPAVEGTTVSYFDNVFCDVGDDQSIEQNLSTFSSHIKNIVFITENADEKSLVLIDEIGAGTDPDEGSALARAVIEFLLNKNSKGIITTHYSMLKEYAYTDKKIMNASMEFDAETFAPLYKINIGMPGSSNAIEISKMLGLDGALTKRAYELLGDNKISFEKVLHEAENARQNAEKIKIDLEKIKAEESEKLDEINREKKRLENEREKFTSNAKAESRRIINEKLEEADEIIDEIKVLFDKAELDSGDLIKARTLRNRLEDKKYSIDDADVTIVNYRPVDVNSLKEGDSVYYKPMDSICKVNSVNVKKGECEIFVGSLRLKVKLKDLFFVSSEKQKPKTTVALKRETFVKPITEINVIGKDTMEALIEVEQFIDQAIINNLEEVKIIHGKGLKILSAAIHDYLRRNKRVESYRFGKYGEGEHGVTFVKLK